MKNNPKLSEKKNTKREANKYIADFKEMPLLMKFFLIFSFYTVITLILALFQAKPIEFEYFNTGYPKNFPIIWYLYSLLLCIFEIVVFFRRSYSLLKKYLYVGIIMVIPVILNSIYLIANLPPEQRMTTSVIYTFSYFFAGLIFLYMFNQKKYFNKV